MVLTLRTPTSDDYRWAIACHHAAYRDVIIQTYGVWDEHAQDGYFEQSWNRTKHDILYADQQRCGYVAVQERPDDTYVDQIVVHPDFQGREIGTTFLRAVMDRAATRGVPVRLRTCPANRAVRLYHRLGFREYERTETQVFLEWAMTQHGEIISRA